MGIAVAIGAFIGAGLGMISAGVSGARDPLDVAKSVGMGAAGGAIGGAVLGPATSAATSASGSAIPATAASSVGSSVAPSFTGASIDNLFTPLTTSFLESGAASTATALGGPTLANTAAQAATLGGSSIPSTVTAPWLTEATTRAAAATQAPSFWAQNAGTILQAGTEVASLGLQLASPKPETPDFSPIPPAVLPETSTQRRDYQHSPAEILANQRRRAEADAKYKEARQQEELSNIMSLVSYQESLDKTSKGRYLTPPPARLRIKGVGSSPGGYI